MRGKVLAEHAKTKKAARQLSKQGRTRPGKEKGLPQGPGPEMTLDVKISGSTRAGRGKYRTILEG